MRWDNRLRATFYGEDYGIPIGAMKQDESQSDTEFGLAVYEFSAQLEAKHGVPVTYRYHRGKGC